MFADGRRMRKQHMKWWLYMLVAKSAVSFPRRAFAPGLLFRGGGGALLRRTTSLKSNLPTTLTVAMSTSRQLPNISCNIQTTLDPCVVLMKELVEKHSSSWDDKGGIYSLAQGVVYWTPPQTCTETLQQALADPTNSLHMYGPDEGLPELRTVLEQKLATENGLRHHRVMITAGANQAYMNVVLTLLDSRSSNNDAVVFTPYYFNHVMAIQMTTGNVVEGPCHANGEPDLDWLAERLQAHKTRLVTLVNPGNPTGTLLSRTVLQRAVELCRQQQCWLVLDNTYEYFIPPAHSVADACFDDAPHVVHIFSLSKAYGMAGYRVGYVAIHQDANIFDQMRKVQDTIPICPSRISQIAALGALQAGPHWVRQQVATLDRGRTSILQALSALPATMGGSGAMYCMAQLSDTTIVDDYVVAERLVHDHGVAVIPGSFCGLPGWIRVCYANLEPTRCEQAAQRLERGLADIMTNHSTL